MESYCVHQLQGQITEYGWVAAGCVNSMQEPVGFSVNVYFEEFDGALYLRWNTSTSVEITTERNCPDQTEVTQTVYPIDYLFNCGHDQNASRSAQSPKCRAGTLAVASSSSATCRAVRGMLHPFLVHHGNAGRRAVPRSEGQLRGPLRHSGCTT